MPQFRRTPEKKLEVKNRNKPFKENLSTLARNRTKALEHLKDPLNLLDLLKQMPFEYEPLDIKFEASKRGPAINFFITVDPEKYFLRQKHGSSGIEYIRDIGDVSVNIIYIPKEKEDKHQIQTTLRHEEAHTATRELIDLTLGLSKTHPEKLKQRLYNEFISIVASNDFSGKYSFTYNYRLLDEFIRDFSRERKLNFKQQDKLKMLLYASFQRREYAIRNALTKLPRIQVVRILRSSNWQNIEKDLKAAIASSVYSRK